MTRRQILQPSPAHPIDIEPLGRRVTVQVDGIPIAQSDHALALREASYPLALYIPRSDVRMEQLQRAEHLSYCPYKGDANYYSIPALGPRGRNAVWTYETPYVAVAAIKDYLAFYPDRVEILS